MPSRAESMLVGLLRHGMLSYCTVSSTGIVYSTCIPESSCLLSYFVRSYLLYTSVKICHYCAVHYNALNHALTVHLILDTLRGQTYQTSIISKRSIDGTKKTFYIRAYSSYFFAISMIRTCSKPHFFHRAALFSVTEKCVTLNESLFVSFFGNLFSIQRVGGGVFCGLTDVSNCIL